MLIGGGLIGAGIKYLGGGVFCGENDMTKAPRFGGPQLCDENGAVVLAFGAMPYVMLGLVPIFASIFIQIFGSPFLKSTFIFWALIIGSIVSMIYQYTAGLKGSIGEGPNHSIFSDRSLVRILEFGQNSFKIQEFSLENSKISEIFNIF